MVLPWRFRGSQSIILWQFNRLFIIKLKFTSCKKNWKEFALRYFLTQGLKYFIFLLNNILFRTYLYKHHLVRFLSFTNLEPLKVFIRITIRLFLLNNEPILQNQIKESRWRFIVVVIRWTALIHIIFQKI